MKEITLAQLLDKGQVNIQEVKHGVGLPTFAAMFEEIVLPISLKHPTPEDALQRLCEQVYGDDALLDLDRSAKWREVNGPDGVAGLRDGEAGIVVCRDGKLELLERITPAIEGAQP